MTGSGGRRRNAAEVHEEHEVPSCQPRCPREGRVNRRALVAVQGARTANPAQLLRQCTRGTKRDKAEAHLSAEAADKRKYTVIKRLSSEPPLPSSAPLMRSTRARARLAWRHAPTTDAVFASPSDKQGRGEYQAQRSRSAFLEQEAWVASLKHRGHILDGIASGACRDTTAAADTSASSCNAERAAATTTPSCAYRHAAQRLDLPAAHAMV